MTFTIDRRCYDKSMDILEHVRLVHTRIPAPIATEDSIPSHRDLVHWLKAVEPVCNMVLFRLGEEHGMYAFLSEEFVSTLAKRLIPLAENRPIVECFSGRGLLSWWLAKYGVPIIATDENTTTTNHWVKRGSMSNVIQMDAFDAVKLFRPRVVLASWVPYQDKTPNRFLPDIDQLVWIGEGDGGCCGHDSIWKNNKFDDWEDVGEFSVCKTDHTFNYGDDEHGRMRPFYHQVVGSFTPSKRRHLPRFEMTDPRRAPSAVHSVNDGRPKKRKRGYRYYASPEGDWICNHCQCHRATLRGIQRHYAGKHDLKKTMRWMKRAEKAVVEATAELKAKRAGA